MKKITVIIGAFIVLVISLMIIPVIANMSEELIDYDDTFEVEDSALTYIVYTAPDDYLGNTIYVTFEITLDTDYLENYATDENLNIEFDTYENLKLMAGDAENIESQIAIKMHTAAVPTYYDYSDMQTAGVLDNTINDLDGVNVKTLVEHYMTDKGYTYSVFGNTVTLQVVLIFAYDVTYDNTGLVVIDEFTESTIINYKVGSNFTNTNVENLINGILIFAVVIVVSALIYFVVKGDE